MVRKEVKDKKVGVFRIETRRIDGFEVKFKCYLHSRKSGGFWTYVRDLSERERLASQATHIDQTLIFKFTNNPILRRGDFFMEFAGSVYRAVVIDNFEFRTTDDLTMRGDRVNPPEFEEISYD